MKETSYFTNGQPTEEAYMNELPPPEIQYVPVGSAEGGALGWFLVVFLLFWVISGIAAFFMSILCFAYSGSVLEKIGGFAISIIFGPFYWIYYAFVQSYCRAPVAPVTSAPTTGGRRARR